DSRKEPPLMSNDAPQTDEASAPPEPGLAPPGGVTMDFLPANLRKHVDPTAPVPLRTMAATALVPRSPNDLVGALYLLTFDPEATVRETARTTAVGLPDRILASALRDEGVQPPVLGYFLRALKDKDVYAEMLILNGNTPDDAIAEIASTCSQRIL